MKAEKKERDRNMKNNQNNRDLKNQMNNKKTLDLQSWKDDIQYEKTVIGQQIRNINKNKFNY